MFYDHGIKVNMLYYNLKHEDVMKKYDSIQNQYRNINKLFNLPETKETNFAILQAYNQIIKDVIQFVKTGQYAIDQISQYRYNIAITRKREAGARKICEKSISKEVSSEWLQHINNLYEKIQTLDHMQYEIQTFISSAAERILLNISCGISCNEESLTKKEKVLESYSCNLDELSDEMDYFLKNDSKLNSGFVTANLQALKIRIEGMASELDTKRTWIEQLSSWLVSQYKISESYKKNKIIDSYQKRTELKKKLKKLGSLAQKCQDNDEKYVGLLGKCFFIKQSAIELPKS